MIACCVFEAIWPTQGDHTLIEKGDRELKLENGRGRKQREERRGEKEKTKEKSKKGREECLWPYLHYIFISGLFDVNLLSCFDSNLRQKKKKHCPLGLCQFCLWLYIENIIKTKKINK